MSQDKITLTFEHPTNKSETLTARVSRNATPNQLVEQLIAHRFMQPAESVGQYKLRTQDGTQLLDDATLADAGLSDGALLTVDHAVTAADIFRG
jgi:WXG100 protein secretion system (Wss), protein YukD